MPEFKGSAATHLVVTHVRGMLDRGDLRAGDRLPAERELARQLGVSRPSLRAGLRSLAVIGVVQIRPGAGSYIAAGPPTLGTDALSFQAALHQDGTVPGKMQYGSAWWFLDQLDGMKAQMDALSHMGLLSRFVGMVTDSRSFLSYSRHEYFRRLLCNLLGDDVRRGMLPDDRDLLGRLVRNVSFNNARDYFGFPLRRTGRN